MVCKVSKLRLKISKLWEDPFKKSLTYFEASFDSLERSPSKTNSSKLMMSSKSGKNLKKKRKISRKASSVTYSLLLVPLFSMNANLINR